jgi:predicted nucleic acid-binding protein
MKPNGRLLTDVIPNYLALAKLRGCEFWTTDERLYKAVRHDLTWVKWLGDFDL